MMQPSDEIKSKLDIVDVLRDYMPLTPAGINFRAKCPFHREKTASFMISPEKQIWHCFGCGKGGDIFRFIMEMEGVEFVEALRMLAPKAGVVLKKVDPQQASERNRLLDLMDLASRYFHEALLRSPAAKGARDYLAKRGLDDDTINNWVIGYSLDEWENLLSFLHRRNFKDNEIFLAGLSVKSNQRAGYYDRFRGRIMFPIRDLNGQVVAFTARVSPEKEATETMGKYINSPQTPIYDKSKIVFGLDLARQPIKQADLAIIVEGQMDCITAHQFGYKNVVATSGTALTSEQINLIKRYSSNIALSFDMDAAGEMASERGIKEAMAADMNIKVILLPAGKDPDECIRKDSATWEAAVADAKPFMRYYFDKTFARLDLGQPEAKREAAKILIPVIVKLKNRIDQDHWLKELSEVISTNESMLREVFNDAAKKAKNDNYSETGSLPAAENRPQSREEKLSELLLALILKNESILDYSLNHIQLEHIIGEANRAIYKNLVFYYNSTIKELKEISEPKTSYINYQDFRDWLIMEINETAGSARNTEVSHLDKIALLSDRDYYQFEIEQAKNEAIKIILALKKNHLSSQMREVERMILAAEKAGDMDKARIFMEEFKILSDGMRNLND